MKKVILSLLIGLICGFGQWSLNYYVDDFGDKTDEAYIFHRNRGTFSNSATTNSSLIAQIIIVDNYPSVRFYLFEYGEQYPSVGSSVGWARGELKLKLANDTIETYRLYVYSDNLSMTHGGDDSLLHRLKKESETMKCHIRIDREYSSTPSEYNFKINPMGFSKAYARIIRKEE